MTVFNQRYDAMNSVYVLTCNGDKIAIADLNDVISGNGLSIFGIGIGYKRADSTPGREHVSSTN